MSSRIRDVHLADWSFAWTLRLCATALVLFLLAVAAFLVRHSLPTLHAFGFSFITSSIWDPVSQIFGAGPVIFGTIVSSTIAVALATPLSIGVGLFLTQLAPPRVARVISFLVDMLAAIPSVVYGLWGIFVLAPWLRKSVEPFLENRLGFLPFFKGPAFGIGMLAAGLILAIMITPTIFGISKEVFLAIPRAQCEAALALGATRWEMMKISVLKPSRSGVGGAVILGLGRALGETMAVTMVIGNRAQISASLFAPAQTMASVIANEYAEASNELHLSALIEIGLVLFLVTLIVNSLARLGIRKFVGSTHGGAK